MTLCTLLTPLCTLLTLSCAHLGDAAARTGPSGPRVVVVELCVVKQDPERVEAALTTPLEKRLLGLPGVETLNSNTHDEGAVLEIHFKEGASEDDAASVALAVDRSEAPFLSRSVRLDSPRPDSFPFSRSGCTPAQR
jgi:hypothetical protein